MLNLRTRLIPRTRLIAVTVGCLFLAAWIRSNFHADTLFFVNGSHIAAIGFARNSLAIVYLESADHLFSPGLHFRGPRQATNPLAHFRTTWGAALVTPSTKVLIGNETPLLAPSYRLNALPTAHGFGVGLPLWLPVALSAVFLRSRKPPSHLCPHCRYDLRATPTQCPECGYTPTPPSHSPARTTSHSSATSTPQSVI